MAFFRRKLADWRVVRNRVIVETSDYINECLRNPDLAVRIPAKPAEKAYWPREFAERFWSSVL